MKMDLLKIILASIAILPSFIINGQTSETNFAVVFDTQADDTSFDQDNSRTTSLGSILQSKTDKVTSLIEKNNAENLNFTRTQEIKSWDNHEIISFGFYHKARVKYKTKSNVSDTSTIFKGGGLTIGRWDWIMPSSDMYCYVEGTGLMSNLFKAKLPTAGLFEACYGGFFKHRDKKVRWGMGCGFGFRSFFVETPNNGLRGAAYGMIWPEVVALIRLSEHITIVPKYILCPMINNGLMGLRTSSELFINFRLLSFIGANIRLTSETIRFNDEIKTSNAESFSGKSNNLAIQFGISFNRSIKNKTKVSRDN